VCARRWSACFYPALECAVLSLRHGRVGISVTLSKHLGHLLGMKRAMKQIVYWLGKASKPRKL